MLPVSNCGPEIRKGIVKARNGNNILYCNNSALSRANTLVNTLLLYHKNNKIIML